MNDIDNIQERIFDLDRFVKAQEGCYDGILAELRNGKKVSHWIWYIFPQKKGLGRSWNSEYYGLEGEKEAVQYLAHPILGKRLDECCQMLLLHKDSRTIHEIMGSGIDVKKLRSCMRIFNSVSPNGIFEKVLREYYSS